MRTAETQYRWLTNTHSSEQPCCPRSGSCWLWCRICHCEVKLLSQWRMIMIVQMMGTLDWRHKLLSAIFEVYCNQLRRRFRDMLYYDSSKTVPNRATKKHYHGIQEMELLNSIYRNIPIFRKEYPLEFNVRFFGRTITRCLISDQQLVWTYSDSHLNFLQVIFRFFLENDVLHTTQNQWMIVLHKQWWDLTKTVLVTSVLIEAYMGYELFDFRILYPPTMHDTCTWSCPSFQYKLLDSDTGFHRMAFA